VPRRQAVHAISSSRSRSRSPVPRRRVVHAMSSSSSSR
jgi:hypothetical protein